MGRRLRSRLPILPDALVPEIPDTSLFRQEDEKSKTSEARYYNRRNGTKQLSELSSGDRLLVWDLDTRTWRIPATLIQRLSARSYLVELDSGRTLRRNRHQLQARPAGMNEIELNDEMEYDIYDCNEGNEDRHIVDTDACFQHLACSFSSVAT